MSKKRNPETPPMLNDEARQRELDALDRYALETEQPGKQTTYDPTAGDPDRSWMKWHEALTRPVERQDFSGGPTLEDSWRFEYKDATGFWPDPKADISALDKERARVAEERRQQEQEVLDKERRGVFARINQLTYDGLSAGMKTLSKMASGQTLAHQEAPENWQKVENMFGIIGIDQDTQDKIIGDLRAKGIKDPFKLPVDVWAQSITGKTYDELVGEFQKHEELGFVQKLWKSTGKAALSEMYKVAVQQFVGTGAATLSKYMGDLANRDVLVSLADAVNPKGKVIKNAITDAQVAVWNWADQHISKMENPEQKIELFGKTILKWDNNERSIRNVKDPWSFMEFAFSNAGQGIVQIPLNVMTRGLSGYMQELGSNYLEQVRRTGEEMGITPGEVIKQGHDDRAMAAGFALMQAMLEHMGAAKVWKGFTSDQIKSGWIRSMANFFSQVHSSGKTEFWTEAAQGFLGKYQAEHHALEGKVFKAIKNMDVIDLIDEGAAGYFGGAGVHVAGAAVRPLSKALNDYREAKTREALADKLAAQFSEKGINVTRGQIYERLNQLAGWKLPRGVEMPEHVRLMRDDYIGLQESAKKLSEQYKKDADPRTMEALIDVQRVLEPFSLRQELWAGEKIPREQFNEWVKSDDNTVRNTRAAKDYFDKKGKLIVTAGGLINNEVLSGLYDADINSVQTFTEAAEKTYVGVLDNLKERYQKKAEAEKTAKESKEPLRAIRTGDIQEGGAYFSLPGASTYYDLNNESARQYDVSGLKFLYAKTPEAISVLEEAIKDPDNTGDDVVRIQEALDGEGFIDYLLNDEVPSVVKAAQRQGYDGIVVFENDDITDPSSAFIWNTDKVKQIEPVRETYEPTTQPEPVVSPAEPTVEPTPQPGQPVPQPPVVDQRADIERRWKEELNRYEGRRANAFSKYNPDGENTALTEEDIELAEKLIKAAKAKGYDVDRTFRLLHTNGFSHAVSNSPTAAKAFLAARLSGEIDYRVNGPFLNTINAKYEAELAALEGQTQPAPAPEPVAQRRETPEQIEEGRRQLSDQSTAEDIFAFVESIPEGTEFSFLETGETVTFEQSDQEGGRRAEMFVKNPETGETRRALTMNRKPDGEISQRGFLPYIFTQQEQVPAITIKPKEDASPVRETEGQVQPEGQPEPAGRKDEGGENIQPPTEGAPEPTTVKKQPQEGEITQPTEEVVEKSFLDEIVEAISGYVERAPEGSTTELKQLMTAMAEKNIPKIVEAIEGYGWMPVTPETISKIDPSAIFSERFKTLTDYLVDRGLLKRANRDGVNFLAVYTESAPEPTKPAPAPAVIDEIRGIWGDIIGEEATAEPTPAPATAPAPAQSPEQAFVQAQFVKKYKDQAMGTEQEIAEEMRIADQIIPKLILEVLADGKWLLLSRDNVAEAFPDEKNESVMKAVRFLREEGVIKKYTPDKSMAQFIALQATPDPSAMEAARLQEIAEQQLEKTRKRKAAEREAEPQVTVISIDGMVETVRALGKEMWGNPSKHSPEKALAMAQLGQAVANVRTQEAEDVALMYLMLADGDISVAEYDKFIQDLRFSNKLMGPARYPESADPRPQEPPSIEPPTALPQAAQLTVTSIPVSDIKTDTKRFQGRGTAYSTETFNNITNDAIAGKFDITRFNPIAIWKDPKDGQYYTLNHSRLRAFEYLSNYGPTLPLPGADFFKNIPTVDMSHLTEQEATKFAKDDSNFMGTAETDLDGARRWKEKRDQGQSTASIREDMRRRPNRARLELLSYLKEGGKTWDMIAAVAKAETTQNRERAYQIGEFIGEARKAYPNLTDSHENEMFEYLFQGTGKKLLVRKDWMDRLNLAWTRGGGVFFDYAQPLNLENATTYGSNEQGVIDEINNVNRQIKSLEKERSRTTGEARIAEINREIEYLSKRLAKLNKDRKAAREGDAAQGQIDLFGPTPQPAPENAELVGRDSPKFGKYIGKNNFGEIIYEDRNGVRTVLGDGGIGRTEAVGMVPTNQGIQVITPNPSERGDRYLTPEEIAMREVADQEQRSRTEQIQDKVDRAKQELKDIWNNEFGRSEGAMMGVSPKQFEAAGKLIAKAAELGVYKFEQIIEWIRDNLGARALEQGFDAFRAAYVATIAGNNVHNEDLNRISNYTVNDFQAATTKPSETEPAGPVEATRTGEDVTGLPGGQGGPTGPTVGGTGQVGDGDATGVRGGDGGLLVVDGTNPTVTEAMGGRSEPAGPRVKGKGVVEHALNHNNLQIPADFVHDATFNVRKKIEDNIAALELLAELKQHGAQATPGQMQTLFRYVGWGGLKDVLLDPEQPRQWTQTGEQNRQMFVRLHELINDVYGDRAKEIIDGMRKSALNAHYTAIPIVRAMYDVLEQAGLPFKNILEPSAGIGHFIGAMPQHMQSDSRWTGVELDPVTGDILKALYPGATIKNTGLEKANLPADFYDLVVGNIPFGKYKVWDESWRDGTPAQKQAMNKIHNYFFAKAIESAKPNGIIAFITTMGVLDSPSNEFLRKYIASNTEFLGAMRMPNTAFKANANTEVATDIIFLRKFIPGESKTQKHDFQKVVEYKNEFEINEYFARNPDMTFGEYRYGGGMYNESSMTIDPKGDVPIHTQISRAATKIFPAKVIPYNPRPDFINATQEAFANVSGDVVRNGNLVVQKGVIGIFDRGQFKPVGTEIRATPQAVSDYASLRTAYRNMVITETQSADEAVVSQTRQKLNDAYDNFVKQHGRIADNVKWIKNDIDAFNIMALEKWDDGEYRGKADMFSKRTINPVRKVDMVDSPQDAVVVTMGEYGRIVPERISQLLGVEWNDALQMLGGLVFELPEGGYMDREGYLSGNVKAKLKTAKAAAEIDARFNPNVEALESVQPETVPISDIGVNIGARWIPADTYAAFLTDLLDTDIRVIYNPAMDNYIVAAARFSERQRLMRTDVEWGTNRADALDIAQYALNSKVPNFKMTDPADQTKKIPDVIANQEAKNAIERMRLRFETWAKTEEPHATDTERIYNDRFVTTIRRNFDGTHLTLPGYAGPKLMQNQLDAVWMTVLNQGGIIDHGVGFGKSLTMIVAAMEMKRMGIVNKPMIVTLKRVIDTFARTAQQAYPGANILYPSPDDFTPAKRKGMLAKIASNNYDLIVVSMENFLSIPADPDVVASVVEEQIAKLEEVVYSIIETLDTNSPAVKRLLKDLENKKADLEAKLLSAINDKADESLAHLGQTGIDMLFFDESHKYKNLAYTTKLTDVRGLGDVKGNDRSAHTLVAARQMQKMRNGDKGVAFASGTTITNTVAEVYNLLTYLRPQKMKELGMETFDNFASTFAEISSKTEITAAGTIKNVMRIRKFRNLPELSMLYAEIADVKNDYNFRIPKPQYQGGKPKLIVCKADRQQKAFMRLLMDYGKNKIPYEGLGLGPLPGPNSENAKQLIIDKLAEKAAIDMRLLFPDAKENPTGKIRTTAHMVAERYFETNHQKGTQAIFCDTGTPKGGRQFSVYDRLREILVSEYGIPKSEIAFIHEFNKDAKANSDLERRLNSGEIRIVVGHSISLGTGMNFQERGAALYHMDVLYTPDNHTQRDGRFVRQGNVFAEQYNDNEVPVYYIGAEMSLDARKFDLNDTKSRIIHQFKTADINMREVEDMPSGAGEMDFGEWSATIMGSPLMLEKGRRQTLEVELSAEKGVFEKGKRLANLEMSSAKVLVERSKDTLSRLRPDNDAWQQAAKKDTDGKIIYQVQVGEKIHESAKEAGIALKAVGAEILKDGKLNSKQKVGEVYGHNIYATLIEELLDVAGQLKVRRIHWTVEGKSGLSYQWGNIMTNEGDIEVTLGRFPIEAMNHIETLIGNLDGSIAEKTDKIEKLKEKWAGQWQRQQEFEENKLRLAEIEQLLVGEELRIDEEVDEVMGDVDGFDMPASFKPRDPTKIPTEAVSDFEQRRSDGPVDENGKPFKIYEEFINLMRKWAPNSRYGEGKTNRAALGTYFPRGKHIRSKGVNDFAVNMHELAHAIDDHYGIIRNLIPDSYEAQKLREIYKEFYGAPSDSHSVQRQLAEGYAMLIEMTIKEPTMMNRRFPEIIRSFLTNGGANAFKDVEMFMSDVENVIIRFHRLPSLEQAGAFIRDDKQVSAVIGPSEHWNAATILEEQMFDRLARIEELVRRSGKLFTSKDVAQNIRFSNNALQWADQNIAGFREEYWHMNEKGELKKVFDYNYKTIEKGLKEIGKRKEFGWYLYFRRIHFEYQRMREMEEQRNIVEEELHSIEERLEAAKTTPGAMTVQQIEKLQTRQAILKAEATALTAEIKRLAEILSKERHVSELQAKDAYQRNEGTFVERDKAGNAVRDFEAMHDALTLEDLKFLASPMVQIITPDEYQMYSRRKGYVHFRREKYDELRDPDDVVRTSIRVKGQTKLSALKERKGSTRVLLDPFVGSQINHQEIMIQGMRQAALNKFKDLAADYPEIFKTVPYYPGIEQSPGHIIIRDNYKRKVYYAPEIAPVIEENYSYQPPNFVDAAVLVMGRMFRAGTTSLYWQFPISNWLLDQTAAAVNSRNKMLPFYSSLKMTATVATQLSWNTIQRVMGRAVNIENSPEAYYFKEWLMLGGTYQTFAFADRDTLRHTPRFKGANWLSKVANAVNQVGEFAINIMSVPGIMSEIMTRATEYILAMKAGYTQFSAFEQGGRVSGPFHHVGSWKFGGKTSAAHYIRSNPYANAGLQVFHQNIRTAYQHEGGAMRIMIAVTGLALTQAASLFRFMSHDDDDEQKKILKTIPVEMLGRYLYFPNPFSDDKLLRVRVPENLTPVSTLISMMVLEFYDQTTYTPQEWGIASTAWLPQQWQFFEPVQMLMSYFPPIIKGPIEVAFNTKTFPDVRPIEMPYEQYKRPSERYGPYTSEFAKDAAKALEEFGDLDIKLGISPKKIDHLLENAIFGRSIRYVTGKPGAYDFRRVLQTELWMAGTRQLKFYYEVKDELDQKIRAHNDGSKRLSEEEYRDLSQMRNILLGTPQRSYRTKKGELRVVRSKNGVDDLLKIYKNIDDEKDKVYAQKVTGEIFDRIREVERIYYGKGKPGEKRQKK